MNILTALFNEHFLSVAFINLPSWPGYTDAPGPANEGVF